MHLPLDTHEEESSASSPQDEHFLGSPLGDQNPLGPPHSVSNDTESPPEESSISLEDDLQPAEEKETDLPASGSPGNPEFSGSEDGIRPPLIDVPAKSISGKHSILTSSRSLHNSQTTEDNPGFSVFQMGTLATSTSGYLSPSATRQLFPVPARPLLPFTPDQRRFSLPGPSICFRCGEAHDWKDCPYNASNNVSARRCSVHVLPSGIKDGSVSV